MEEVCGKRGLQLWGLGEGTGARFPQPHKGEQGATAVGLDAVVKDVPDLSPWT